MAMTDDNGMVMPVTPYGGGFGNNGGLDDSIIVLFFLMMMCGWGNGGFGGYGGNAGFVDSSMQRGFDQAAVMNGITGVGNNVVSGFGDTATNLCGGFANVTAAINNGFAQSEIAANARAMSDMQQMFALQSQLAQCCCDNRLANCQTQNLISTESASTRSTIQDGVQKVLDMMCSDKIDAKNEKIADLEREISMATLAASQTAQTAEILSRLPAATA